MRKYQWLTMMAFVVLVITVCTVENGVLSMMAGVVLALIASIGLVFSMMKLDVFDFPEDSMMENIVHMIQEGFAQKQCETIPKDSSRTIFRGSTNENGGIKVY